MPYIITTHPPATGTHGIHPPAESEQHATATLDEARTYAFRAMVENWPDKRVGEGPDLTRLSNEGTTIPLPDGTAIEVRRVTWRELAELGSLTPARRRYVTEPAYDAANYSAEILDAWNKD